jgi:hypothetical protein
MIDEHKQVIRLIIQSLPKGYMVEILEPSDIPEYEHYSEIKVFNRNEDTGLSVLMSVTGYTINRISTGQFDSTTIVIGMPEKVIANFNLKLKDHLDD